MWAFQFKSCCSRSMSPKQKMTTFFKHDSFPKEPSRGCKDPTYPLLYTQPCLVNALSGCAQLHITPLCSPPVPNPSLVWKGWAPCASKDILQLGQPSDSSRWCEQQIWCQEQLTVHSKKRHTNPLDFSTKLALVTSLCQGDWKPKSTLDRTEFLLWLLTKSKEALLYF